MPKPFLILLPSCLVGGPMALSFQGAFALPAVGGIMLMRGLMTLLNFVGAHEKEIRHLRAELQELKEHPGRQSRTTD